MQHFFQLNGLENKNAESGNPGTMKKTETLAKSGGFLNLVVVCICFENFWQISNDIEIAKTATQFL